MYLTEAEKRILAGLLREHAILCRSMGNYENGEDYPGTLKALHSIAKKAGIDSAELEDQ